jgi:hypothetical protein
VGFAIAPGACRQDAIAIVVQAVKAYSRSWGVFG